MTRIIAKLFAVAVALTPLMLGSPAAALPPQVAYVSSTGSDANPCTAALPCATVSNALTGLIMTGGVVSCIDGTGVSDFIGGVEVGGPVNTIDCPGGTALTSGGSPPFTLALAFPNQTLIVRHLTFNLSGSASGAFAIEVTGSGNLILEDCVFENIPGVALEITPNGPLNLVIKNSRISNNAAGVVIQPGSGGSVTATFDGVTITENSGGGLKTDTINGGINLAISNSTISKNGGNGVNAVGGAGGQNVLQLTHDVIAYNSVAGVQANGASAAVLVNNTSILNNATGATSLIANGRILTYGNNSIVGLPGSGFTGPASLQ